MEIWQANGWTFILRCLVGPCCRSGTLVVHLLPSRINSKLSRFVTKSRDPWVIAVDALVSVRSVLPDLGQFCRDLPQLLRIIEVIYVAPNWPKRVRYSEVHKLFPDTSGAFCHKDLSSILLFSSWVLQPCLEGKRLDRFDHSYGSSC